MPVNLYILMAAVATAAGFVAGLLAKSAGVRLLPSLLGKSADSIGSSLAASGLLETLAGEGNFADVRPLIEEHIDDFLQHKLPTEMPMIGMFIGDKTIAQLKSIFMKELEEIFPVVINRYLHRLLTGGNMHALLSAQLARFTGPQSEIAGTLRARLSYLPWYGAAAGLIIALLQSAALSMAS